MTSQIADAIMEALEPLGVFVVVEAEHMCMTARGVRKPGALTMTSAVRGAFQEDEIRLWKGIAAKAGVELR